MSRRCTAASSALRPRRPLAARSSEVGRILVRPAIVRSSSLKPGEGSRPVSVTTRRRWSSPRAAHQRLDQRRRGRASRASRLLPSIGPRRREWRPPRRLRRPHPRRWRRLRTPARPCHGARRGRRPAPPGSPRRRTRRGPRPATAIELRPTMRRASAASAPSAVASSARVGQGRCRFPPHRGAAGRRRSTPRAGRRRFRGDGEAVTRGSAAWPGPSPALPGARARRRGQRWERHGLPQPRAGRAERAASARGRPRSRHRRPSASGREGPLVRLAFGSGRRPYSHRSSSPGRVVQAPCKGHSATLTA